ncbi:MAG: hypothetical protein LAQ30_10300 [Acidobacteriia bacterium]|nr:hypothetical protein [Terriglobia bacterium]
MQWLLDFWSNEQGQDLIEYSLLITFIAVACLAFLGAGHPSVVRIWSHADNTLRNAGR